MRLRLITRSVVYAERVNDLMRGARSGVVVQHNRCCMREVLHSLLDVPKRNTALAEAIGRLRNGCNTQSTIPWLCKRTYVSAKSQPGCSRQILGDLLHSSRHLGIDGLKVGKATATATTRNSRLAQAGASRSVPRICATTFLLTELKRSHACNQCDQCDITL